MDIQTIVVIVFVSAFILTGIYVTYKSENFKKQEYEERVAKLNRTKK